MSNILYSNCLNSDIERIVGKRGVDISEEDLSKIKKLSLSKKGYIGEDKDYYIIDLIKFLNLEVITLNGFMFSENDIIILNSLPKLKFIHFDFCDFDSNEVRFNSIIESIVINCCKNISLTSFDFSNVEFLKFISSKSEKKIVNMEDFKVNGHLKDLSINNCRINNIENVLQIAPNVVNLNIDGSEILAEKELNSLKIKISHQKEFHRVDS